MEQKIIIAIDDIIKKVDHTKREEKFANEVRKRKKRFLPKENREIMKVISEIIAFSQNAKSEKVEGAINSEAWKKMFSDFDINKVAEMNPCALSDEYWSDIKGIRQKTKLFQIVMLARRLKEFNQGTIPLKTAVFETEIPERIRTHEDIDAFWKGFEKMKKNMEINEIPFLRSTTTLLHFLLHTGYDCIKPDSVVMKVAKDIGIVEKETGEKNLKKVVSTIQEYCLCKSMRPPIIDLYLSFEGNQSSVKKFQKGNVPQ